MTAANNIQVQARLRDPLNLTTEKTGVGTDIQWMPPGRHMIWPDGFDQPFEQTGTPAIAQVAASALRDLRSQAAAGKGNWPYLDFNHEDGAQSGEPLEFYWGGDDPKAGGVRLKVNWSGAGESALRERTFRSFSPSWRMDKDTKQFLGVGLNMGGLVNRSAFQTIAAVAAKGQAHPEGGPVFTHEIYRIANDLVQKEGLSEIVALTRAVEENPKVWDDYIFQLTGHAGGAPRPDVGQFAQAKLSQLPFLIGASVYAHAKRIADPVEGQTVFARTPMGRDLYRNYHASIIGRAAFTKTSVRTEDTPHAFIVRAKAYAAASGIADEPEAQARFAATADGRQSYQAYRESLR